MDYSRLYKPAGLPLAVRSIAVLLLLTAAALAVHGYHIGVEDQAIYLPAVKLDLDSSLYSHDREFFLPQTRPTLIDEAVAATVRTTHGSVEWAVFAWHVGSLFLFLFGCLQVARRIFLRECARWAGVSLVTTLLTIPVTGTALYLIDQYLHPRALATAFILFAAAELLPDERKARTTLAGWVRIALWVVLAALVHIQMAFFGVLLLVFLVFPFEEIFPWERQADRHIDAEVGSEVGVLAAATLLMPLGTLFQSAPPEWREAMLTRSQHFLLRWEWYEWLGVFAPMALLWWFALIGKRMESPALALLCRRLTYLAIFVFVGAAITTIPSRFERLTPFQPMRMFHLIYVLMFLVMGGLLGEYVLQKKVWRWVALFLPICAGMFYAQRELFPSTRHIEWPGRSTGNGWVEAFAWVRKNTPKDAFFAMDPHYISSNGEDYHGFRGLAERGQMADRDKDPGVVTLFPAIAPLWHRQVYALDGWAGFNGGDFHRLHTDFGVNWVILAVSSRTPSGADSAKKGLDCPYRNSAVFVCKVE
ncbi:MAG TPA: hypothetical protein VN622_10245 [Clostridia bacterium]|nr:hypothetical protein [Clostridia bacterium]